MSLVIIVTFIMGSAAFLEELLRPFEVWMRVSNWYLVSGRWAHPCPCSPELQLILSSSSNAVFVPLNYGELGTTWRSCVLLARLIGSTLTANSEKTTEEIDYLLAHLGLIWVHIEGLDVISRFTLASGV